jgi:dCTP deaminase
MSIQSDRPTKDQAIQNRMTEPPSEEQPAAGVISHGPSPHGDGPSFAGEFKILTNANSARIAPKALEAGSLATMQAEAMILRPNPFAWTRSVECFRIPRDVLTICVGKSTYARCGIARERDAIRAGAGGIRDFRNPQHYAATGQGLRQRGAVPDIVLPLR